VEKNNGAESEGRNATPMSNLKDHCISFFNRNRTTLEGKWGGCSQKEKKNPPNRGVYFSSKNCSKSAQSLHIFKMETPLKQTCAKLCRKTTEKHYCKFRNRYMP